jgi:hypothetical protein
VGSPGKVGDEMWRWEKSGCVCCQWRGEAVEGAGPLLRKGESQSLLGLTQWSILGL